MLESTSILVNKLCLRITRGNDASEDMGVGDIVLGMMYKQISDVFNILFDWRTFSQGGTFITADNRVRGIIQTAQTRDEHMLWAARLGVKDDSFQRRRWVYNMSIIQNSDEEICFYYAKFCQDHLAGSIKSPRDLPKTKDTLPGILFSSPRINCMIGKYAYPRRPVVLDEYSINAVVDVVMDQERPIPIMLITCPDVVSPEIIYDMTEGNLIVVCCDDARLLSDLNTALPRGLFTQWDSIHILMPLSDCRAYHPTYTYTDIRNMGIDAFLRGIHQAFCESLRSKEKHAFLTVEDVEKCRNRGQANQLVQTCEEQKGQIKEMEERLAKQNEVLASTLSQLQEITNRSKEMAELEELLNESMSECSDLKRGISARKMAVVAAMISAVGVGLGAFLTIVYAPTLNKDVASSIGMDVIIAIVFGGMPVSGGPRSRITAAVVGAFSMGFLTQIMTMLNLGSGFGQMIKAAIFLAVVFIAMGDQRGKLLTR